MRRRQNLFVVLALLGAVWFASPVRAGDNDGSTTSDTQTAVAHDINKNLGNSSLSGGAIAGISATVVAVLIAIGVGVCCYLNRQDKRIRRRQDDEFLDGMDFNDEDPTSPGPRSAARTHPHHRHPHAQVHPSQGTGKAPRAVAVDGSDSGETSATGLTGSRATMDQSMPRPPPGRITRNSSGTQQQRNNNSNSNNNSNTVLSSPSGAGLAETKATTAALGETQASARLGETQATGLNETRATNLNETRATALNETLAASHANLGASHNSLATSSPHVPRIPPSKSDAAMNQTTASRNLGATQASARLEGSVASLGSSTSGLDISEAP